MIPTRLRHPRRAVWLRVAAVGLLGVSILGTPAAGTRPGATPAAGRARYSDDPAKARESVLALATHTLERPNRAHRLFVEAYFMRSLIAAYEVSQADGTPHAAFDAQRGLDRAIAFADTLVNLQNKLGYWPLGYPATFYADMGAALALFPAVEPYVDEARLRRYQAAVETFLRSLQRDKMLHADGSVGIGRALIVNPVGFPQRASPEPYLVSSALVGIETRAWLYRRTRKPELREQAKKSLEYTLAQISPDGFREPAGRREGSIRIAAYVQEGWMAADAMLDDPAVLVRLRTALPAHIDWLLREQRKDGTWDAPEEGSFARTPAIVTFLMWYDERCKPRADVRAAVRRASATLANRDKWDAIGLWGTGDHEEVLRALAGRPLAALAQDKYMF